MKRLTFVLSVAITIFSVTLVGCSKEPDTPPTVDKKRQEETKNALGGKFKKSTGKSY